MKTFKVFVACLALMVSLSSCTPDDPIENVYTMNVYPGNGQFTIGDLTYQYEAGYFKHIYLDGVEITGAGEGSGLVWKGAYNPATTYQVFDVVYYSGSSYVAIQITTNHLPTDEIYWSLVAAKGDTGAAGADGEDGAAGPNTVSSSTSTSFDGLLTGDGDVVGVITLPGTGTTYLKDDGTWGSPASAPVQRIAEILVTDPNGDAITTGDGKAYLFIPAALNGYELVSASACVTTASSSGLPSVAVYNVTDSQDILSVNITIDSGEKTSYTAETASSVNSSYKTVATGDEIRIDIDGAGTGAKGLTVILVFGAP